MEGYCFIDSICPSGLLSFPPSKALFGLKPLNVIIGPNASGKSNLIDIISLLPALATDLSIPFGTKGTIRDWYWGGAANGDKAGLAINVNIGGSRMSYVVEIADRNHRAVVENEIVSVIDQNNSVEPHTLVVIAKGRLNLISAEDGQSGKELLSVYRNEELFDWSNSFLTQIRDSSLFPTVVAMAQSFRRIKTYAERNFGRSSKARDHQPADQPGNELLEDLSNLAMVVNEMQHNEPLAWAAVLSHARKFNPTLRDISIRVVAGRVQLMMLEEGIRNPIPATRLSDGTIHFLSLLLILCHPNPPPLVCIEEPELGLHPDMLKTVAELLIDASQRMQLIVTTHSDVLVSALSDVPEAVVVCEKDEHGTKLKRLDPVKLKSWLDDYLLGEIWSMGEIGGNRW